MQKMKLKIQLFGGRGASSNNKSNLKERIGLKSYFKPSNVRENLRNVAFKSGKNDLITDGYSIYQLNNSGLEYSKDKSLTESVKRFETQLNDLNNRANNYKSIDNYITDKEDYKINKNYSFNSKNIKQARSVLGKSTKVDIVYNGEQPFMVFKNKKGEKGFLLPQRIY